MVITGYATSSPTAAGNDYAEMYPVSNPNIVAGDIVAVDTGVPVSMNYAVAGSNMPLAGIVSTNPGQVLGDQNAVGDRPIALSGRVPAHVNLEGGPISIGDRIAPHRYQALVRRRGSLMSRLVSHSRPTMELRPLRRLRSSSTFRRELTSMKSESDFSVTA